jgi:hypothetical protein
MALWNKQERLKFFPPENPNGISFSIGNLHGTSSGVIEVETTTIPKLLSQSQSAKINILKLDIEGAEFEVLEHMFASHIFPDQILVEVDEFLFLSLANIIKGFRVLRLICKNGYDCLNKSDDYEYTFKLSS